MSTAKERVEQELKELKSKIDKIVSFRTTAIYESLSHEAQLLLVQQEIVMEQYATILAKRLAIWED